MFSDKYYLKFATSSADYYDLSGISIAYQCSGYGDSGCMTGSMDVTVYSATQPFNYGESAQLWIAGQDESTFPRMNVQSRKVNGDNTIAYHLVDAMASAAKPLDLSSYAEGSTISGNQILTAITQQMDGVNGWFANASGIDEIALGSYPVEEFHGKTIQSILGEISAALVAVWWVDTAGQLILVGLGSDYSNTFNAGDHEKTVLRDTITIVGLEMKNNDTGDVYSWGNTGYGNTGKVFRISSRYATQSLSQTVWGRVGGYIYQAWSCGTCIDISGGVPFAGAFPQFTDENGNVLLANSVRYEISGQNLYASLSANDVSESEIEYKPKVERELAARVEYDKPMAVSAGGYQVINENKGPQTVTRTEDESGNVTVTNFNTKVISGTDGVKIYDGVGVIPRENPVSEKVTLDANTGNYTSVDTYQSCIVTEVFNYDKTTGDIKTISRKITDLEGNPI